MNHKHTKLAVLASATMLAGCLFTSPVSAQRVEVGNAASVVGDVTMRNAQVTRARPLLRKQRIAWGDEINTGRRSQMQILLLDRSAFGIGARSQVQINRYVYDPEEGRSFFATFVKGALRFFSGSNEGENSGEIETPAGRIGIRGTAVDMLVGKRARDIANDEDFLDGVRSDKNEATLVVLRGPGAATRGGLTPGVVDVTGAGVTVTLNEPGLAAFIPRAGAAPIGPFRISDGGLGEVQERLSPEVTRANSGGSFLNTLIPAVIGAAALGLVLNEVLDNNQDDANATGANDNGDTAGTNYPNEPVEVPNPNGVDYPTGDNGDNGDDGDDGVDLGPIIG